MEKFDRLIDREKFFIKGQYLINFRKFLEQRKPGLFDEIRQAKGLGNLLASSKVPLLLSNAIIDEAAIRLKITTAQILTEANRLILEEDLNGILKLFMRVSGAENILKRSPQISKTYTDYFDVQVLENRKGHSRVKITVLEEFKDYLMPSLKGAGIGICNICKTPMKSHIVSDEKIFEHNGKRLVEYITTTEY